jgi:hypothetical protein
MLEGDDYNCDWCQEQMAEADRFYILVPNATHSAFERKGSFCTPECAAGFNSNKSINAGNDAVNMRHRLLEQEFGRVVKPAPPANMLAHYNKRTGLTRAQWLPQCHATYEADTLEMIRQTELQRRGVEIFRVVKPQKK